MIGKIIGIKDMHIYLKLEIDIYQIDNLIGKNIIFNNKYAGEIINISNGIAEIILIGEFINEYFVTGCLEMPPFSSECRLASTKEICIIYGCYNDKNYLRIGYSYVYRNLPVMINVNNYFSNHFAILGNTGSGKSYYIANLLQKILYNKDHIPNNANIFLFDVYGEYSKVFPNMNNINHRLITTNIKDNTNELLFIPFWFLGVDDLCLLLDITNREQISIIEKTLKMVAYFSNSKGNISDKKNDILAKCILDLIFSNSNLNDVRNKITNIINKYSTNEINLDINLTKGGWTRSIRQCIFIEDGKFADIEVVINYLEQFCLSNVELNLPDGTCMYSIDDFSNALEFTFLSEGIFNSSSTYEYANNIRVKLNSLINSKYASYFRSERYMTKEDFIKYLLYKESTKYQIIHININAIEDRFAKVIVKIFSKMIFDYSTSLVNRASMPFHIILEEAHRYITKDIDNEIIGYNIFERIAKEGRKYGVILGVITQRPSEVSPTIISQCSNFSIFKMFNPIDVEFIRNIMPEVNDYLLEKIKMLKPGNCFMFGNAMKMPLLTIMDIPNPSPYSDNCNILNTWYPN